MLSENAYVSIAPDLRICRLLNGMWQVSGAHGAINPVAALQDMMNYHLDGFTTWDLADHYGPAEDFIGMFRHKLQVEQGDAALVETQAFTKWVPRPTRITRQMAEEAINAALSRMKVTTLDMVQFHWWDYSNPAYLDALKHLSDLQAEGKIRHLGLTNFDTERLEQIVGQGIQIVSNQVQFSIIDQRPLVKMAAFCAAHDIALLTYGTFCGGMLSADYLHEREPSAGMLTTASLRKYKYMIDSWGGWALFQQLLMQLHNLAQKHQVSIANVSARYILDQPSVAGVIVGARLGERQHRAENARVFDFNLSADDIASLRAITDQGKDLFQLIGDCGDEYRH